MFPFDNVIIVICAIFVDLTGMLIYPLWKIQLQIREGLCFLKEEVSLPFVIAWGRPEEESLQVLLWWPQKKTHTIALVWKVWCNTWCPEYQASFCIIHRAQWYSSTFLKHCNKIALFSVQYMFYALFWFQEPNHLIGHGLSLCLFLSISL